MAGHIDGALHRVTAGTGPGTMLMVHPMPTDHTYWLYQMSRFSTVLRVIAVDLPGFGGSPPARTGLTVDDLADACWEAVGAEEGDGPCILAGVSVGATTVLRMAAGRPERVAAVVVSGTGFVPAKAFAHERIAGYRERGMAYRREHLAGLWAESSRRDPLTAYFLDTFTERDRQTDLGSILHIFRALTVPDSAEQFRRVTAPTLIVTGDEDAAHRAAFPLAELLPDARLEVMRGAGHYCNLERPWEWDRLVLDFLGSRGLV